MFKALVILVVIASSSVFAYAEELHMQVVIYPPLAYEVAGELRGVAPEVVQAIQTLVGDTNPLIITPWLRAYNQTQKFEKQGLFAIVRIPEREKLFKWVGPVFGEGDYFFKRTGSDLKIEDLDDARNVSRIAVRKDGYTHQLLASKNFTNLDVGPTYDSSYKKLAQGRVDLVLMGERTYFYMVKNAGLNPAVFERVGPKVSNSTAWLAFSLDVSDATIVQWQNALDQLKADGTYDAIMERNFRQ